jgi:hypothetical protein
MVPDKIPVKIERCQHCGEYFELNCEMPTSINEHVKLLNCREKPDPYWPKLFCKAGSVWQSASQIQNPLTVAMRFISAGTSEAEVERTLSRQKDIQRLHGRNFGTQFLMRD